MSADRTAILALGMQGSGMRTFSHVATLLGCELPVHFDAVISFNDELLASAASSWNDWLPLNQGWEESAVRADFLVRAQELLQTQFGSSRLFLLADMRICRLAPFWLEALAALGIRPVIALPQRDPVEVSHLLAERDGFPEGFGLFLWLRHVLEAEAATRNVPRLFFNRGQLLANWGSVVENLERAAGLRFARRSVPVETQILNFLADEARQRHEARGTVADAALPAWVQDTHEILDRWCRAEGRDGDLASLDAIRTAFDDASPSFSRAIASGIGADGELGAAEIARTYARVRDDLAEQLDEARNELQQSQAECAALTAARDRLALQVDEVGAHVEVVRAAHEAVSQARAELAATSAELEGIRRQHETATRLHAELTDKLAAADEEATRLRGEVAQIGSAMRQRQEEIAQAWAEVAAERTGHARADAELRRAIDQNQRLLEGFARIEARIEADSGELAETRLRADETQRMLTTLRGEQGETLALLGGKDVEIERLRSREARAHSELAQLAILYAELKPQVALPANAGASAHSQQQIPQQQTDQAGSGQQRPDEARREVEWLREATNLLHRRPAWWSLLGRKARQRQERELLEAHGLFDSAAYLARNPDVAREGIDPLLHYMRHGLSEGRTW